MDEIKQKIKHITILFLFVYPPNFEHIIPPAKTPKVGPVKHNILKVNKTLVASSKFNTFFIYSAPQYCTTAIPKKATEQEKVVNINITLHKIFPKLLHKEEDFLSSSLLINFPVKPSSFKINFLL